MVYIESIIVFSFNMGYMRSEKATWPFPLFSRSKSSNHQHAAEGLTTLSFSRNQSRGSRFHSLFCSQRIPANLVERSTIFHGFGIVSNWLQCKVLKKGLRGRDSLSPRSSLFGCVLWNYLKQRRLGKLERKEVVFQQDLLLIKKYAFAFIPP